MLFSTESLFVVVATFALVVSLMILGLVSTGLQEADDPSESSPDDLTGFEKRHTHRTDIRR